MFFKASVHSVRRLVCILIDLVGSTSGGKSFVGDVRTHGSVYRACVRATAGGEEDSKTGSSEVFVKAEYGTLDSNTQSFMKGNESQTTWLLFVFPPLRVLSVLNSLLFSPHIFLW